jgi:hypothetical protein
MIELQTASLDAYSHTRDLCVEVLNKGNLIDPEFSNFAHALLHYYSDRIQSLSLLNQNGRLWDAEIVYRSALECSTRLIYVCIADEAEKKVRVREFFHDLQEVEYLERTSKAETAVTNSNNEQTRTFVGGVVLSKEDELKLRKKWPKKARKMLKQKWSFSEMVREITCYNNKNLDLTKYSSLLYSYNLSSHLIHADHTALELTWDRNNNREPLELQELIKSHTSKMLTEPVSMLVICLKSISLSLGIEFDTKPLEEKLVKMNELGDKLHDSFYATQSNKYYQ